MLLYIDPGIGSLIFQIIIAFVTAILFFFSKVRVFFSKLFSGYYFKKKSNDG
jgi:hypothetical protein